MSESIFELSARTNSVILQWIKTYPKGNIIATVGIGEDGHVAGMMPFPEDQATFERLFMDPKHFVVGYEAGNKNKFNLRLTSTITLLKKASYIISYVVGDNKRSQLIRAQETDKPLHECPSRILFQLPHGDLFTDIEV